jgi:uncharacterized membrane protein
MVRAAAAYQVGAMRAGERLAGFLRWVPLAGGITILLFGTIYALFNPPLQVPDEPAHFLRAYEVAGGACRDSRFALFPRDVRDLHGLFPGQMNEQTAVDTMTARLYAARHIPRSDELVRVDEGGATASYSCLTYVPAAAGIALANAFRAPAIDVLWAARIGNIAVYAALAWLALSLLPLGLRPLGLLITAMPMSLAQAASASQDPIVNAVGFVYVAYALRLAWATREHPIAWREIGILLGLALFLGQAKLDLLLVALLLMVAPERWRGGRQAQLGTMAASLAVGAGILLLWQHIGGSMVNEPRFISLDHSANARFVLHQPLLVVERFIATLQLNGSFYLDSFIGRLGWLDVLLPRPVIVVYFAALIVAALAAPAPAELTRFRRLVGFAVWAAAFGLTFMVFWYIEEPSVMSMQFVVGQGAFDGVQGRYFIPFALPLALALLGLVPRRWRYGSPATAAWAVLGAALVMLTGTVGAYASIYREFYLPQQEVGKLPYRLRHPGDFYNDQFIHEFGASPKDDQVLYVHARLRYWIENGRWFRKHHMTNLHPPLVPASIVRRITWGGEIWDPDLQFHPVAMARKWNLRYVYDAQNRIWLVTHGVRHLLVDSRYILRDRYPVFRPPAKELKEIPVGDPVINFNYLDGKLVQAPDAPDPTDRARVYIVLEGRKRWVTDSAWLTEHKLTFDNVEHLPFATVDLIPDDRPLP